MIAIASDHAGYPLKEEIKKYLDEQGIAYKDCGAYSAESCDYAVNAQKACDLVASGQCEKAILCCGTGIGMALAADKVAGIRAASITTPEFADLFRRHNDGNVVCLSGRFVDLDVNKDIIKVFLTSEFEGGRHAERVAKIMKLD